MSDLAQWDVRGPVRSQLPAALLPCAANACAILNAIERVPAREMFDVTATTSPRPGKVMNEVEPPTGAADRSRNLSSPPPPARSARTRLSRSMLAT